jgi:hypothetical protein
MLFVVLHVRPAHSENDSGKITVQKMAGVELDKTLAATAAGGGVIICICVRH